MRLKPILIVLAALAIVTLVVWQITQAVRHTFQPPAGLAQLDRSTPAYQNGFTLLEIDNVSPDRIYSYTEKGGQQDNGGSPQFIANDTGLWIQMAPYRLPLNCLNPNYPGSGCSASLSVNGRDAAGNSFPLIWRTSLSSGLTGSPIYLLASIPVGYPDTIRGMDVTVSDSRGETATWRITHLPPMQHVLTPPIAPQTTFHQGNIQVVARVYGGLALNTPEQSPALHYDLKGTITHPAHQWELGNMTETLEWEPPGYVPQDSGSTMGSNKTDSSVNFALYGQSLYYNRSYPYLKDTHFVRLGAKLQEFETYDETVVFHNVSVVPGRGGGQYLAGTGPETVTTPSGVTVTLDDVQNHKATMSFMSGTYSIHLLYPQSTPFLSLPNSPLWRKYKSPVTIDAAMPKPYSSMGSSRGSNEGSYQFEMPGVGSNGLMLPKVIANFPVIIRQRVNLRSVPMTFTLPVLEKQPTKPL